MGYTADRVFEVLEVENEIISKENAIIKNFFESDITIKISISNTKTTMS
jgi:hypothetical protein